MYVVRRQADGWWYGVCGKKYGYFPATHVRIVKKLRSVETPKEFELHKSDSLRPGGQPIKDPRDLKMPLRPNYSTHTPNESEVSID